MSLDNTQQPTQPAQINQAQAVPAAAPSQQTNTNLLSSNVSQSGGSADWKTALDSDMQAIAKNKGWNHPNEAIKSYAELEKKFGNVNQKQVIIPKDDAPEAEWNAYYQKLGRPQKSDDYKVERSKDFQFYDETATAEFKQIAHEAGLTPTQFKKIHDKFYAFENKRYAEQNAKLENRTLEIETNLKKEWGAAYTPKMEAASIVAKKYFGGNPDVIDALHQVMGEGFYKMLDDLAKVSIDPKITTGHESGWAKTPDQARAEIKRLQSDPEFLKKWMNRSHPDHQAAHEEITRLHQLAV